MLCIIYGLLFIKEKTIGLFDTGNYHKKTNIKYRERASFFHFRGLLMPMCRSPPFLSKNAEKKKWFDIIIKMHKRS